LFLRLKIKKSNLIYVYKGNKFLASFYIFASTFPKLDHLVPIEFNTLAEENKYYFLFNKNNKSIDTIVDNKLPVRINDGKIQLLYSYRKEAEKIDLFISIVEKALEK
jgi:hypothetical protein